MNVQNAPAPVPVVELPPPPTVPSDRAVMIPDVELLDVYRYLEYLKDVRYTQVSEVFPSFTYGTRHYVIASSVLSVMYA